MREKTHFLGKRGNLANLANLANFAKFAKFATCQHRNVGKDVGNWRYL